MGSILSTETGKTLSIVATLVRIHLISMLDVYELLCSKNRRV